jgi:hypothetical protein
MDKSKEIKALVKRYKAQHTETQYATNAEREVVSKAFVKEMKSLGGYEVCYIDSLIGKRLNKVLVIGSTPSGQTNFISINAIARCEFEIRRTDQQLYDLTDEDEKIYLILLKNYEEATTAMRKFTRSKRRAK